MFNHVWFIGYRNQWHTPIQQRSRYTCQETFRHAWLSVAFLPRQVLPACLVLPGQSNISNSRFQARSKHQGLETVDVRRFDVQSLEIDWANHIVHLVAWAFFGFSQGSPPFSGSHESFPNLACGTPTCRYGCTKRNLEKINETQWKPFQSCIKMISPPIIHSLAVSSKGLSYGGGPLRVLSHGAT